MTTPRTLPPGQNNENRNARVPEWTQPGTGNLASLLTLLFFGWKAGPPALMISADGYSN